METIILKGQTMDIRPSKPSKDRPLPPAGMQQAVLYQVVALGTQKGEWAGKPTSNYKLNLAWEIPGAERIEYDDGTSKPSCIFMTYNTYLTEKATLGIHLTGYRGKAFTKEEVNSFPIGSILKPGLNALLNIVHGTKQDGSPKATYSSISPLMAGMTEMQAENPLVEYSPSMGDNFPESLPDWAIEDIKKSPEYQQAINGGEPAPEDTRDWSNGDPDEDIPF
jgi:hypothetical protein